jgi:BRCA1-like protein
MQVTQTYARPSSATFSPEGMRLDVSAEQSRPPVHLQAIIGESLAYGRLMLALYQVVSGDLRSKNKDHSAYQAWVQQRYMDELSGELAAKRAQIPGLMQRRDELRTRVTELEREVRTLERAVAGSDYHKAKREYFDWLYKHDPDAWWVLDPVVSVHPDCLFFEVFSQDESSYGRVTVPTERLTVMGDVLYGTTNIDFSRRLAREMERVRNYRPAWLEIGAGGVTMATGAGEAVEKKIDLPPSWVRGFLQVQSAATYPHTDVKLSAETLAEILSALRRQKEDKGPRSLQFSLMPGQKPVIYVEPWNIEIREPEHVYSGDAPQEVRLWGRRRLLVLESLLPYVDAVQVRLLGSGMPSYWSLFMKDHRFDLGLSGWTRNDWSQAARFDLLASTKTASEAEVSTASKLLEERLHLTTEELAQLAGMSRQSATSALQQLCSRGRAMYDHVPEVYRWRPLFPPQIRLQEEAKGEESADSRLEYARSLVAANAVSWTKQPQPNGQLVRYEATVRGKRGEKAFEVILDLDEDGRARYAQCNCSWHRREKLRKGPCGHILATAALAAQSMMTRPAPTSTGAGASAPAAAPSIGVRPDQFKGMVFVFTGTLSWFTRDQAEEEVKKRGGHATGSVSRNTSYLVTGDKPGSKLKRAQDLGIPVITEAEFQELLRSG